MDDTRKNAYRYIIYWAMLEIRQLQWQATRPMQLLNPFKLYRAWKLALRAGALAEWLHNAAHFSSFDFEAFREDWFWDEYDRLVKRIGGGWYYRERFEDYLRQKRDETQRAE